MLAVLLVAAVGDHSEAPSSELMAQCYALIGF